MRIQRLTEHLNKGTNKEETIKVEESESQKKLMYSRDEFEEGLNMDSYSRSLEDSDEIIRSEMNNSNTSNEKSNKGTNIDPINGIVVNANSVVFKPSKSEYESQIEIKNSFLANEKFEKDESQIEIKNSFLANEKFEKDFLKEEKTNQTTTGTTIGNLFGVTGKTSYDFNFLDANKKITSLRDSYNSSNFDYKKDIYEWKPGETISLTEGERKLLVNTLDTEKSRTNKAWTSSKKYLLDQLLYVRAGISAKNLEDPEVKFMGFDDGLKNPDPFDASLKTSEKEILSIEMLKNRLNYSSTIGYLYVRDFGENDEVFNIPFEFNPQISEGSLNANYASEKLLGRIGQYYVYTGTDLSTLNIVLEYKTLAEDGSFTEKNIGEPGTTNMDSRNKQFSTDVWQYFWTPKKLLEIEYKIRSLVLPDVTSENYLKKPPIIEVHLYPDSDEINDISGLFSYPIDSSSSNYISVSKSTVGFSKYKKYIVNSVQIESDYSNGQISYPTLYKVGENFKLNGTEVQKILNEERSPMRRGFKATLQCTEITENFLDIVPDSPAYRKMANSLQAEVESGLQKDVGNGKTALEMLKIESLKDSLKNVGNELATRVEEIRKANRKIDSKIRIASEIALLMHNSNVKETRDHILYDYINREGDFSFLSSDDEKTEYNINIDKIKEGKVLYDNIKSAPDYLKDIPLKGDEFKCKLNNTETKILKEDILGKDSKQKNNLVKDEDTVQKPEIKVIDAQPETTTPETTLDPNSKKALISNKIKDLESQLRMLKYDSNFKFGKEIQKDLKKVPTKVYPNQDIIEKSIIELMSKSYVEPEDKKIENNTEEGKTETITKRRYRYRKITEDDLKNVLGNDNSKEDNVYYEFLLLNLDPLWHMVENFNESIKNFNVIYNRGDNFRYLGDFIKEKNIKTIDSLNKEIEDDINKIKKEDILGGDKTKSKLLNDKNYTINAIKTLFYVFSENEDNIYIKNDPGFYNKPSDEKSYFINEYSKYINRKLYNLNTIIEAFTERPKKSDSKAIDKEENKSKEEKKEFKIKDIRLGIQRIKVLDRNSYQLFSLKKPIEILYSVYNTEDDTEYEILDINEISSLTNKKYVPPFEKLLRHIENMNLYPNLNNDGKSNSEPSTEESTEGFTFFKNIKKSIKEIIDSLIGQEKNVVWDEYDKWATEKDWDIIESENSTYEFERIKIIDENLLEDVLSKEFHKIVGKGETMTTPNSYDNNTLTTSEMGFGSNREIDKVLKEIEDLSKNIDEENKESEGLKSNIKSDIISILEEVKKMSIKDLIELSNAHCKVDYLYDNNFNIKTILDKYNTTDKNVTDKNKKLQENIYLEMKSMFESQLKLSEDYNSKSDEDTILSNIMFRIRLLDEIKTSLSKKSFVNDIINKLKKIDDLIVPGGTNINDYINVSINEYTKKSVDEIDSNENNKDLKNPFLTGIVNIIWQSFKELGTRTDKSKKKLEEIGESYFGKKEEDNPGWEPSPVFDKDPYKDTSDYLRKAINKFNNIIICNDELEIGTRYSYKYVVEEIKTELSISNDKYNVANESINKIVDAELNRKGKEIKKGDETKKEGSGIYEIIDDSNNSSSNKTNKANKANTVSKLIIDLKERYGAEGNEKLVAVKNMSLLQEKYSLYKSEEDLKNVFIDCEEAESQDQLISIITPSESVISKNTDNIKSELGGNVPYYYYDRAQYMAQMNMLEIEMYEIEKAKEDGVDSQKEDKQKSNLGGN